MSLVSATRSLAVCIALLCGLPYGGVQAEETEKTVTDSSNTHEQLLIDFAADDEAAKWVVINDGVMGGRSQSGIKLDADSTAVFAGTVSLENNGGFASVRTVPRDFETAGYMGVRIRVRGDGQRYRFRIRTDKNFDGMAYQYDFETSKDEWTEHELPFSDFVASFRGRRVPEAGPLDPSDIKQIGFLIADYQEGPFRLQIDWIKAYR